MFWILFLERGKRMHNRMTEGSPLKLILMFAMPVLLGNVFQQFYNMADTMMVGRILGVDALAAMGATASVSGLVLGLNIGADDYITKPFNPLEMIARVKSQLRRYMQLGATAETGTVIEVGGLSIDLEAKTVMLEGEPVKVTPIEYRILELFLTNLNRVFSIDEIYERVWNETSFQSENTVAVHIRRIREKIEIDPKNPRYIKVVWGIGYKIEKN